MKTNLMRYLGSCHLSLHCLLFTALLLAHSGAFAATQWNENITLSGFGSWGLSQSDQEVPVLLYRDIDHELCLDCDNTLGVQLDWSINHHWRASLQVVKRPQDTFSSPSLERALIEFRWDDWQAKVGRQRIPLFAMSEYLFVSQAFPWFRTPNDVYDGILGMSHYEGIAIETQRWLTDELPLRVSLFAAVPNREEFEFYGQDLAIKTEHEFGLTAEMDIDDNLLRATVMQAKYRQTEAQLIPIFPEKETLNLLSVGGHYQLGSIQFISEALISSKYHSNWYASLIYQVGDLSPYLTYSQRRKSVQNRSYLLGSRYDVTPNVSLYAEWQYIDGEAQVVSGHFTELQFPPTPPVSDVHIYTLGLSFTF